MWFTNFTYLRLFPSSTRCCTLATRSISFPFHFHLSRHNSHYSQVYELQMYGPDYVWILPDHSTPWWNATGECSNDNLARATEGLILVSHHDRLLKNETSISGMVSEFEINERARCGDGLGSLRARSGSVQHFVNRSKVSLKNIIGT